MLTWLLILVAAVSGSLLTYLYDPGPPLLARLCGGISSGLALLGLIGFAYASFLGLTPLSVALTVLTLTCALLLLLLTCRSVRSRSASDLRESTRWLRQSGNSKSRRISALVVVLILTTALVVRFASGAIFIKSGAVYTNSINNVGDLPLHVSMITGFVYGQNFPPEHTQFAGARLTYPFITDFISAMFMRAGATLRDAIFIPTAVLLLALIGLGYRWAFALTRDRFATISSLLLLFFSGGFGWWLFIDDVQHSGGNVLKALMYLSHEYTTETAHGYRWGNLLATILLPQRSSLLGTPLVISIMTLWWQALDENAVSSALPAESRASFWSPAVQRMLGAGFLAGLLPLVHTTSFIVMMAMAGCLALLFWRWRAWTAFFMASGAIALAQVWWFGHGSSVHAKNMFAWQLGWDRGSQNAVWFWIKNAGLFLPLLLVALVCRGRRSVVSRRLLLFYAPFLLCFVIPNVARLMPWIWDNIKALIIWYIASVPLVALLLARIWRRGGIAARSTAIVLLILMILAGSLDVCRVMTKTAEWTVFDPEAVACADTIKALTPARAVVLHAPINNHAVFLTGRRSLLGLTFMAWVHGLDYGSREGDIERIYTGAPGAESLLRHYAVDYVVVGPAERNYFKINEVFLSKFLPISGAQGCELRQVTHH